MNKLLAPFMCLLGALVMSLSLIAAQLTPSNGSACISKSLYCLDEAMELSQSMQDEGEKGCIQQHLSELKKELQTALKNKDFQKVGKSCMYLCENAHEILAECSNPELRTQILSCLCSMAKEVEKL